MLSIARWQSVEQYLAVLLICPLFDVLLDLPFNELRDLFVGEQSRFAGTFQI